MSKSIGYQVFEEGGEPNKAPSLYTAWDEVALPRVGEEIQLWEPHGLRTVVRVRHQPFGGAYVFVGPRRDAPTGQSTPR